MVLSITPPDTLDADIPKVFIDRDELKFEGLAENVLNTMGEGNFSALLIKGSKELKWRQAHVIMNTIAEGGLTKMLLATDKEK